MYMENNPVRVRIATLRELDALVGEHLAGEVPEVYWEDAHAVLRFETEYEAVEAMRKKKEQMNLPKVDWASTEIVQIKLYRPYSSDMGVAWTVIEKINTALHPLQMFRDKGQWHAAFGDDKISVARSSAVALCLAGLMAIGIEVELDRDRIH